MKTKRTMQLELLTMTTTTTKVLVGNTAGCGSWTRTGSFADAGDGAEEPSYDSTTSGTKMAEVSWHWFAGHKSTAVVAVVVGEEPLLTKGAVRKGAE